MFCGVEMICWSIKWVTGNPGNLMVKVKQSSCSGSATLRQLNPIHKKVSIKFAFFVTKDKF